MAKKDKENRADKLTRKEYEQELRSLQAQLCKLQDWVKYKGLRIIVIFEGRDAAGKGGTIRAITERVSPRVFRQIALPAPSDREKTQMYMQRYMQHFPAAGEIVIFDRSWYNRAGVEYVMGFCTKQEHERFLNYARSPKSTSSMPALCSSSIGLRLERQSSSGALRRAFRIRYGNGSLAESFRRWYEYSRARDLMIKATSSKHAPWYVIRSDDKKRARLNCISHLLSLIAYKEAPRPKVKLPKRATKGSYDDQAALMKQHFVPEIH